jgi:branched-chain amino acid transport system permease protein
MAFSEPRRLKGSDQDFLTMAVTRYCTRTYLQDQRIFPSPSAKISLVLFVIFLILLPAFAGEYLLLVASLCGIATISALGLNILTGYTGQLSLGHAAFMAIGGYTVALMGGHFHFPFELNLISAGVVASIAGLVVAIPSLRLKGLYLIITTMAFQFIVEYVLLHWESLTEGERGIPIHPYSLFQLNLDDRSQQFYVVLVLAIGATIFTKNLAMSRSGRAFVAVRDHDIAAEIIGVNLAKYKIMSFITSSFMAGIGGCLYAYVYQRITPEIFTFIVSIEYVAMIIVGGMGTVIGGIFGACFMTLLPQFLGLIFGPLSSTYPLLANRLGAINIMVYGIIIIFFLLFEPDGLFGIWIRIKNYWKPWPFKY